MHARTHTHIQIRNCGFVRKVSSKVVHWGSWKMEKINKIKFYWQCRRHLWTKYIMNMITGVFVSLSRFISRFRTTDAWWRKFRIMAPLAVMPLGSSWTTQSWRGNFWRCHSLAECGILPPSLPISPTRWLTLETKLLCSSCEVYWIV